MENRSELYTKAEGLGVNRETIDNMVEFIQKVWNTIKDTIKNILEKIEPFIEKLTSLSNDNELRRLSYMESKVKTKRLKKKYRDKKMVYISMKYRKC